MQALYQLEVRFAVFLHGDMPVRSAVEGGEKFAPGVRLGRGDRHRNLQLAERGQWFRASSGHVNLPQRFCELLLWIARRQNFMERPGANAGKKNHQVEFTAKETLREFKRFGIALDRRLAHGRSDERIATLPTNQFCPFPVRHAF